MLLGVLAAVLLALVVLLHAPFVRSAVLDYALDLVERDYALVVRADRLDYNLARLRLELSNLRVSAPHAREEPFVTAESIAVQVPWSVLLGSLVLEDVAVSKARVTIRQRADGTSNLPEGDDTEPDEDPAPLPLQQLSISELSLDLRDEGQAAFVWVPALAVRLTPDEGSLTLLQPAEITTETQATRITALAGGAAFDGRTLHLTDLHVQADEGDVRLDGSLTVLAREPAADMRLRGTLHAARLARWAMANGYLPMGDLDVAVHARGAFDAFETDLTLSSGRIDWGDLAATDLSLESHITTERVELDHLRLGVAGGSIAAAGIVPLVEDAPGRLRATWNGVDAAAAIAAMAPDVTLVPAAVLSGEVDAQGVGLTAERWSGSARLSAAPNRNARGRVALGGTSRVDLAQGAWRLDARHVVGGVAPLAASLRGQLDGDIAGLVVLDRTDIPQLIALLQTTGLADVPADAVTEGGVEASIDVAGRVADPALQGRAVVTSLTTPQVEAARVEATLAGRPVASRLQFDLVAPDMVVAGQPISAVEIRGRTGEPATTVAVDALSARQTDGPGRLTGGGTYDTRTGRFQASIDGTAWEVRPTAELPAGGIIEVQFDGEGTVADPRGGGKLTLRDASWDGTTVGAVDVTVALADREARFDASVPEFGTTATGRVALDAPYAAVVDAASRDLDLARALRGVTLPAPLEGLLTMRLHAELPVESWRTGSATLEIQALDARVGDLPVALGGPARLRYEAERLAVDEFALDAGGLSLSATGALPVFERQPDDNAALLVTATGDVEAAVSAASATGLVELPIEGGTGPLALLGRVTGALTDPIVTGDLELGPATLALEDLPQVSGLRVRARAADGWLALQEGRAEFEGAAVEVTGRAPLALLMNAPDATGDAEVQAHLTNLTPAALRALMEPGTLGDMQGSIDATLELSAPRLEPAAVTGELRFDRFDLRVADLPIAQRVPTRIVARDGFARIEAWEWTGQGATLTVRGQMRLEDRQTALLAGGSVDLRVLTPFVRDAGLATAGRLEPRLSITGPLDNLRVDGDMLLTGGELRLADPRVLVSDLTVRTVLTRTTARMTELTGSVNGGTLSGGGSLEFSPEGGLDTQFSTEIRSMALEFPEGLRTELDADLTMSFARPAGDTADPAGRLAGTVTVRRGSYREPLAVVTGLLAGLQTRQLAAAATPSPVLDALRLDVRVLTDEDVFVDNNYGRFQLGADLRVIGTAAAPALSGRTELREGGQLFVGRNVYALNSGIVDFTDPLTIEPTLNVQATTRAGGEDIQVTITGPAQSPSVDLQSTSSPELGQAEVASLLLTGRRLEDLAPGDAAFVGAQVLGNFSAEVLGFASRAVGLDTLRLGGVDNQMLRHDLAEAATEVDPTTRVTFGKSIGSNLDITLSQSLRDSDAQTWIVDYLPRRGLELRLVSNDDDLRSYGFRHDVALGRGSAGRPAGAPRAEPSRVARVSISGELGEVSEARLRDELRLEEGDRFDFADWQDDRDRIERLYRGQSFLAAQVSARRTEDADGVALVYAIESGPRTRIDAAGITLGSGLRARLEEAWSQSIFDDFLVDEAAEVIRADLAASGYLRPEIDVRILEEPGVKVLDITVDRGPRSQTARVRIDGAPPPLSEEIQAYVEARYSGIDALSDPDAVERDVAGYLRSQGYPAASVAAGAPAFENGVAVLPVEVDPGRAVAIARVAFPGAATLADDALRDAAGLDAGDPYDPEAVAAARNRLVALYRSEGFPDAVVTAAPEVPSDGAGVAVDFKVAEGPRQVLQEISIVGNRAIDRDVIVDALRLVEGDPLRTEDLIAARTRIFNTGLFRRIDLTSEPSEPTGETVPVHLRVSLEEWPVIRLRYGVVVAEERPEDDLDGRELVPGFSADATRRTLFGRAITLGSALTLQRRQQSGRAFVTAPTFLGLPIQSSVIGERSRQDFRTTSLVTSRWRLTWEQRSRVLGNLSLSYSYTFERNHTFDTEPTVSGPLAFDVTINVARLNGAAAWDTRDDPTDATRGLFASSTIEFAPRSAGSDISFVRQLQQAYYFRPWRRAVLASAARVGVVVPLGGQDLIPSERFFGGGSRTVRGVAEDGLGPRDFFGDPAGGETMIVLNQEVRVPLFGWVRGVGFLDAGNVFRRPGDASLADLIGAAGAGLRVATPFALLRVDYGRTIWGRPGSSGRWTFGIGQIF